MRVSNFFARLNCRNSTKIHSKSQFITSAQYFVMKNNSDTRSDKVIGPNHHHSGFSNKV